MKDRQKIGSALFGGGAAMVVRAFYGLGLDYVHVRNGVWLSTIIGALIALPIVMLARCAAESLDLRRGGVNVMTRLTLALLLTLDAGACVSCAAFSAGYIAFEHASTRFLMLPMIVVLCFSIISGVEVTGSSARVWFRFSILLLALVVISQKPYYRPNWLFPALGSGMRDILDSSMRAAGWFSMIAVSSIFLESQNCKPIRCAEVVKALVIPALAACGLIILNQMLSPEMPGVDRAARLDAILTNGRTPLYLQLPMILLWFIGLTHLTAFEGGAAAALIGRILGTNRRVNALAVTTAISLAALLEVNNMPFIVAAMRYAVFIVLLAVLATIAFSRKEDLACVWRR